MSARAASLVLGGLALGGSLAAGCVVLLVSGSVLAAGCAALLVSGSVLPSAGSGSGVAACEVSVAAVEVVGGGFLVRWRLALGLRFGVRKSPRVAAAGVASAGYSASGFWRLMLERVWMRRVLRWG